jgi:putative acetyltransferase
VSRFRIVPFVPAHLAEAVDLWVEAWSRAIPAIDFEARRVWSVDHLIAMASRGVEIVCAFDASDGRMAGFITYDKSGHIDQLVAGVHAWGTGAAVALLDEAKRASSGALHLDVNQDNPRAVRFYEREGFRRTRAGINAASGLATWRYAWRRSG